MENDEQKPQPPPDPQPPPKPERPTIQMIFEGLDPRKKQTDGGKNE